eukprot:TRINITY_DN3130_c1_g1_i1.p1 TRINITY_DN3130_c1_g1~~TRINITY_DN3130_c1_g1_i1.p1  ORF type:complete len:386 (+),score=52.40 TRINITY_DN3130_c1_g1_i1:268-1425(+)
MDHEVKCPNCCSVHLAELAATRKRLATLADEYRKMELRLRAAERRAVAAEASSTATREGPSTSENTQTGTLPPIPGSAGGIFHGSLDRDGQNSGPTGAPATMPSASLPPGYVVRWYSKRLARHGAWVAYPDPLQPLLERAWTHFLASDGAAALASCVFTLSGERYAVRFDPPTVRQVKLSDRGDRRLVLRSEEPLNSSPPLPSAGGTVPPPPGSGHARVRPSDGAAATIPVSGAVEARVGALVAAMRDGAVTVAKPPGVFDSEISPVLLQRAELRREFRRLRRLFAREARGGAYSSYEGGSTARGGAESAGADGEDSDGEASVASGDDSVTLDVAPFREHWLGYETFGAPPSLEETDDLFRRILRGSARITFDQFALLMLKRAQM